jgi:putative acetyltransferase
LIVPEFSEADMVRKYEEKDLEGMLDVWYQASLVAHSFFSEEFFKQERRNIRDIYLDRSETWVYEDEGRIVGFMSMAGNEVGAIFIYPDFQGRGIGRELMDMAKSLHDTLELEVFKENLKARGFYEHYGFVTFKEYVPEEFGRPMLRMRLEE